MNMPENHFDPNDPRLTAYALGELDPADASDVEALIHESPEARAYIEEIRNTAEQLTSGFATTASEDAALTADQREQVDHAIATPMPQPVRTIKLTPWVVAKVALPVAAAAAIVFTLTTLNTSQYESQSTRMLEIEREAVVDPIPRDEMAETHTSVMSNPIAQKSQPHTSPPLPKPTIQPESKPSPPPRSPAIARGTPSRSRAISGELYYMPSQDSDGDGVVDFARDKKMTAGQASGRALEMGLIPGQNATGELLASADVFYEEEPAKEPENWRFNPNFNTEGYAHIVDNPFLITADDPLSTFSIDVDTASYANVRRMINAGQLPPPDAVRIEELINYFDYAYPLPEGSMAGTDEGAGDDAATPFSVNVDVAACPWKPQHQLMRIGLKGWEIPADQRPPANLVFLIDVSGSMNSYNKLPLLKQAMTMLSGTLNPDDRVAIVVYAGASGLVLPSTTAENAETIRFALDRLSAGGSTNGGVGIELAYATAARHFIKGGINRVILATDGDFNIGTTNHGDLTRLIEEKTKSGVFLTVLGFGMGNYKDDTLEKLADKGNGNYAYIDTAAEAQKVLVQEVGSTLVTIAKDVKIQVEFNPLAAGAYRLIGYENRILADRDFNDDTKDAGEIGSGHTVTVLYEIVPLGLEATLPQADGSTGESPTVDPLKYQVPKQITPAAESGELATIKLRYKQPDGDTSTKIEFPIANSDQNLEDASADYHFAAAVAEFGMILRGSPYKGAANYTSVLQLAQAGLGEDPHGYRKAFIELVHKAALLEQPSEQAPPPAQPQPQPQPAPKPGQPVPYTGE
jgi:Ca-activated chloride channel family protein